MRTKGKAEQLAETFKLIVKEDMCAVRLSQWLPPNQDVLILDREEIVKNPLLIPLYNDEPRFTIVIGYSDEASWRTQYLNGNET